MGFVDMDRMPGDNDLHGIHQRVARFAAFPAGRQARTAAVGVVQGDVGLTRVQKQSIVVRLAIDLSDERYTRLD